MAKASKNSELSGKATVATRHDSNSQISNAANSASIYLLRHGAVATSGLLCGKTDISLSTLGVEQLKQSVKKLPKINLCFSSPLARCLQFATEFSSFPELYVNSLGDSPFAHGKPEPQETSQQKQIQAPIPLTVLEKLQEMDFGDWDGKPYSSLWETTASSHTSSEMSSHSERHINNEALTIGDFWENPWQVTPPNGEKMAHFSQRVACVWQNILTTSQGKTALVVTHGGVIKEIIANILNIAQPALSTHSPLSNITTRTVQHGKSGREHLANNAYLSAINIGYASIIKVTVHYDEPDINGNIAIWPSLSF